MSRILIEKDNGNVIEISGDRCDDILYVFKRIETYVDAYVTAFNDNEFSLLDELGRTIAVVLTEVYGYDLVFDDIEFTGYKKRDLNKD